MLSLPKATGLQDNCTLLKNYGLYIQDSGPVLNGYAKMNWGTTYT
jgi:hypothetical protein